MEIEFQETKLLYDDVRQLLYSILLGFQYSEMVKLDPELKSHFTELKELTREMLDEIQRTASSSQYLFLTTFGFLPALRKWVKRCEDEFHIRMHMETNGVGEEERWSEEQELAVYLLYRDWIFQTSRHMTGKYSELSLTITKKDSELQLYIHAPNQSPVKEWWCTHLIGNPYAWKEMNKYHCLVQVVLQRSGVAIIASFDHVHGHVDVDRVMESQGNLSL